MSYCFDTMEKAWGKLREQLPSAVRDSELSVRFEFLIHEMHEANHRLGDKINKDDRVTSHARRLDKAMTAPDEDDQ